MEKDTALTQPEVVNRPSDLQLTLTNTNYILNPKPQDMYPIGERQLDRLDGLIRAIPQAANWHERLVAAAIGMLPPALFYLISLMTLQTVPAWMWVVSWVLVVVSAVVVVLVCALEKQDRTGLHASVQTVVSELQRLKEEYCKPPGNDAGR